MTADFVRPDALGILNEFNPWWGKGPGAVPDLPGYHRHLFAGVLDRLQHPGPGLRRGVVLKGARQVGKTTILKQLVRPLGAGRNVCYVSLDPPLDRRPFDWWLEPWLASRPREERKYLLIDEIAMARAWDRWLKRYIDVRPDLMVAATSSSASLLGRGTRESGVGRWTEYWIPPFSFAEMLEWQRGVRSPATPPGGLIPPPDPAPVGDGREALELYLRRGGFPVLWPVDSPESYRTLRQEGIDRVLERDLPKMFRGVDTSLLRASFERVAVESGRIVSIERVAGDIPCSRLTVRRHLGMFEDAGLLYVLRQYPGVARRGSAGRTKVVLADPALLHCMIQGLPARIAADATRGQLLETVVATHLQAFARYWSGRVTYWGTERNDVDFVLTIGMETIPVQVTASVSYDAKDGADIRLFLRRHRKRSATGLVLYNGEERDLPTDEKGGLIALRSLPRFLIHLSRGSVPSVSSA